MKPESTRRNPKGEALARDGVLNPHPEAVLDPLFKENPFFDPRDLGVEFHESFRVTGLEVSFEVNMLPKRLKEELDQASAGGSTTSA